MLDILTIISLTLIAGVCIPLGGLLASVEHINSRWLEEEFRHFLIALGGGVLLGAVSEVLIPEGLEHLNHSLLGVPLICLGGIFFFGIEHFLGVRYRQSLSKLDPLINSSIKRYIQSNKSQGSPQMMGMLLDYIPEAIALGGMVALGSTQSMLLALLMALQNLPEGFNAYRELVRYNHNPQKTLLFMSALITFGPISGLSGFFFLSQSPSILGGIMLFASGGILYLIFQDIAPQSHLEQHWGPPLGAVFGFSLAIFSKMLLSV